MSGSVHSMGPRVRWLVAAALSSAIVLPVLAQESLLPDGFGNPTPEAPPTKQTPSPTPTPTPRPSAGDVPKASGSSGATTTAAAGGSGAAGTAALPKAPKAAGEEDEDATQPGQLRYDLPPGSRRLLSRIGPLTPESGGLAATSFGSAGGQYLATIMRKTRAPLASRWGHILLRRTLLTGVDTPPTINGSDFVAERAGLLLRMGEAAGARSLVQSVDYDRASPRLLEIAVQAYLANADPSGLCPFVPMGLAKSKNPAWQLANGMCSALTGEPGPAGAAIDRVRNRKLAPQIDVLLAEKVLGAGVNGRRTVTIEWDGVEQLTSWRFGLATATATDVPPALRQKAAPYMTGWTAVAPMAPLGTRINAAVGAAATGTLSSEAYISLLSAAAIDEAATADIVDKAGQLRLASAATTAEARITALRALWAEGKSEPERYAAKVLTARAAAALPVGAATGEDIAPVIAAMLAGGYDRNAMAWVPVVDIGSYAWGMLATGLPRPLSGVNYDSLDDFAGSDDSAGQQRSKMLVAGLAGLGRVQGEALADISADLELNLAKKTRWATAISNAASRGEQGTVAILAAAGMQGADWSKMPPHHLYQIVRALRAVGLGNEARMIAAEAVARS